MPKSPLPRRDDDQWLTVFSGNPFDRVDGRRSDDQWVADRLADPSSRFVVFDDGRPLMRTKPDLDILWLDRAGAGTLIREGCTCVLLGLRNGVAHFAVDRDGRADLDQLAGGDGKAIDLRSVAVQLTLAGRETGQSAILGQARSLLAWHGRRAFCSVCGGPARLTRAGYARRCAAQECGAEHFPRTDPVVIMLGLWQDQCLLGRHSRLPENLYSALAGFVEPGETIEEAVRREMAEEAGVAVGAVRYVASQPWPFPSSLMIGCFATVTDPAISLDDDELDDARWVSRDQARSALSGTNKTFTLPPPIAIASQLVCQWLEETA